MLSRQRISDNRPSWVDGEGARAEGRGGAWWIEHCEIAVGHPYKAVTHEVPVKIGSDNRPSGINAGGLGAVDGAQGIETDDCAIASPQEAVLDAFCVEVGAGDVLGWVDATRTCCCGARERDRREGAVSFPQETQKHKARVDYVNIGPGNVPRRVDAGGKQVALPPGASKVINVPRGAFASAGDVRAHPNAVAANGSKRCAVLLRRPLIVELMLSCKVSSLCEAEQRFIARFFF
jgi:hypothetical protein